MAPSNDPYYNRKPVPNEFIEDVGQTGLSADDEVMTREQKLSRNGDDLRSFWNAKGENGATDPHFSRKPVPDSMIHGVGETGLSPEDEYLNRERKMSVNGVDIRKFGTSRTAGMAPQDDPYYGRKPVDKTQIDGVGDTGYSKAEEYEVRERKQSLFQESTDPFQQITASGHRQSISAAAGPAAAAARRKSSAVGPDTIQQTPHAARSGYGGETLAPIESYTEHPAQSTTTTTTTTTTGNSSFGNGQHGLYHDTVTDPDNVAPHEIR